MEAYRTLFHHIESAMQEPAHASCRGRGNAGHRIARAILEIEELAGHEGDEDDEDRFHGGDGLNCMVRRAGAAAFPKNVFGCSIRPGGELNRDGQGKHLAGRHQLDAILLPQGHRPHQHGQDVTVNVVCQNDGTPPPFCVSRIVGGISLPLKIVVPPLNSGGMTPLSSTRSASQERSKIFG